MTTAQYHIEVAQPSAAHYTYDPTTPLSPQPAPTTTEAEGTSLQVIQNLEHRGDILKVSNFLTTNSFNAFQDLAQTTPTPCILVDVDVVEQSYDMLTKAFPYGTIYFAVKANPAIEITKMLVEKGSSFDIASIYELDKVLGAGLPPERASYGNTIKKKRDIAYVYSKGVRLFATDSVGDLHNIAEVAPGSRVYARILIDEGHASSEWPLSKKFGCSVEMAKGLLIKARDLGLSPCGVSFHVGSQQLAKEVWQFALNIVAQMYIDLYDNHGIHCDLINTGGGLCSNYTIAPEPLEEYAAIITAALETSFPPHLQPKTVIFEPGRSLVGNSGVLITEVVLKSEKTQQDDRSRWLYLDTGLFNGLIETLGEAIKYPILAQQAETNALALCSYIPEQEQYEAALMTYYATTTGENFCSPAQYDFSTQPREPHIIAGPTCDSCDVLYQHNQYRLPKTLASGDKLWFLTTGAYTSSYASCEFNGFPAIKTHCISSSAYKKQKQQQQQQQEQQQ